MAIKKDNSKRTKAKKKTFKCKHCKKVLKTERGFKNHMEKVCKMTEEADSDERMHMLESFDTALSQDPITSASNVSKELIRIARNGRGRPKAIDEITLAKLRFAFLIGCTDEEACLISGIHPATLYRYQTDNADFCEEKEALKQFTKIQARMTVVKNIHHPEIAKWYLELKANDEFSRRTISSGEMLHGIMTPDRAKRAEQILGQFDPNPSIRLNNEQAVVTVSEDDSA